MLGLGMYLTCVGIPICAVAGFVSNRRRLALQWRDELIDIDSRIYPAPTDAEMASLCKVQPVEDPDTGRHVPNGIQLTTQDHFGVHVTNALLNGPQVETMLDELRGWAQRYGVPHEERKVRHFEDICGLTDAASFASTLQSPESVSVVERLVQHVRSMGNAYRRMLVVSDHAVDCQTMKAPWGSGDAIAMEKMPLGLRWLMERVQDEFPGIGRLRHVHMEYSPDGFVYRPPLCPKSYDGHDYVIVPLRRHRAASVVTFCPLLRSRQPSTTETFANSWTSRDVDALVTSGSALRVYSGARYMWSWAMRPVNWFGHCANVPKALLARDAVGGLGPTTPAAWWTATTRWIASLRGAKRGGAANADGGGTAGGDAGVIVLHFEGPRSQGKARSKLLHPEPLIFGAPPQPDKFEQWTGQMPPTEQDVWDGYVILFIIRHYTEMLGL